MQILSLYSNNNATNLLRNHKNKKLYSTHQTTQKPIFPPLQTYTQMY